MGRLGDIRTGMANAPQAVKAAEASLGSSLTICAQMFVFPQPNHAYMHTFARQSFLVFLLLAALLSFSENNLCGLSFHKGLVQKNSPLELSLTHTFNYKPISLSFPLLSLSHRSETNNMPDHREDNDEGKYTGVPSL